MTQSNNASADAVWQEHGDFQVLAVVGSFREHSQQDMHPIVSEYTNLEQCGPFLLSTRPSTGGRSTTFPLPLYDPS